MMDRPVRWGVLGYAGIAQRQLIPAMAEAANAVPYAIASRSQEKLKEAVASFGFEKAYSSYEDLLKDPQVDAVYIPLPNALHKEWTLKAARAGKHVLCEKPLALTAEDCEEMIAVCQECGVKLMEAFMYRLTTRTRKLKELVDSGIIGQIRHINSTQRFVLKNEQSIKFQPELGGGSLWDVGCYPINVIGMLLQDEPVAFCGQKVVERGVDIGFTAVLKYPGGVLCTASSGFDSCSTLFTEINGTQGSLLVRDTFLDTDTPILLCQNGQTTEIPVEACKRYVLEVEAFSQAVQKDQETPLALGETVRNIRLMQTLLEVVS